MAFAINTFLVGPDGSNGSCILNNPTSAQWTALTNLAARIQSVSFTDCTALEIGRLSAFPALKHVSFSGVRMNAEMLKELSQLTQLELVGMRSTGIADAALLYLLRLPCLKGLDLCATDVTEEGIKALRNTHPNGQRIVLQDHGGGL